MNEDGRLRIDPEAGRWLRNGPEAAPPGLLESTLHRTRQISQRPAVVAVLGGAPDVRSRRGVLSTSARWAVIAAVVLVATLVLILASGAREQQLLLVAPSGSAGPSSTAESSTSPFVSVPIYDTKLGISVERDPLEPWTGIEARWYGFDIPGTYDFRYGACPNDRCPAGIVSLSVGDLRTGAVVDINMGARATCPPDIADDFDACTTWQVITTFEDGGGTPRAPIRIAGRSMDELLAAWTGRYGEQPDLQLVNGVSWAIAEHDRRLVAFVVDGDRIVSVTAQPNGSDDAAQARQSQRLRLFLSGITFENPPAPWPTADTTPVTTRWLELEFTLPGWNVSMDGHHLFVQGDLYGMLGPQGFDVERAPLGTEFVVTLGSGRGDGDLVARIGGATFDELATSIEREIAGGATPRVTDVDGHRMLAWVARQQSIVGPLAWIAILDAGDDVYLFQEHYPVDMFFQPGHVDTLLDGLRFVREN